MAKPVIKVYLLPYMWKQEKLERLAGDLIRELGAAVPHLHIRSEEDVIVILLPDLMRKGLGDYIHAEVDVPDLERDPDGQDKAAHAVWSVIRQYLPDAYIQCKVYPFQTSRGFC